MNKIVNDSLGAYLHSSLQLNQYLVIRTTPSNEVHLNSKLEKSCLEGIRNSLNNQETKMINCTTLFISDEENHQNVVNGT